MCEDVVRKARRRWKAMMDRCSRPLERPSYENCKVSEEFKDFEKFLVWAVEQPNFHKDDCELDKDILNTGTDAIYSKETCTFVPFHVNSFLKPYYENSKGTKFDDSHGSYRATVGMYGKGVQVGRYKSELDARLAYKYWKESYARVLAEQYKLLMDSRVYEILSNFEVPMHGYANLIGENYEAS